MSKLLTPKELDKYKEEIKSVETLQDGTIGWLNEIRLYAEEIERLKEYEWMYNDLCK